MQLEQKAAAGGKKEAAAGDKKQAAAAGGAKPQAGEDGVRAEYQGDEGEIDYDFVRNTPIEKKPVPYFCYGKRVRIGALHQQHEQFLNKIIVCAGWARSTRMGGKDFAFIELNDGSSMNSIQVVVDSSMPNFAEIAATRVGASFRAKGKLIPSMGKDQKFELQVCSPDAHEIKVVGKCDGDTYPLPPKRHTVEYLRTIAHLRPRTKLISGVTRVRNNLAYATHKFFQERGFLYIHTPLITASDCEGAGEMFQVTTALPEHDKPISALTKNLYEREGQENEVDAPKDDGKKKKDKKKKGEAKEEKPAEEEKKGATLPFEERKINYKKDFFGKPAFLTVSGQLSVENFNNAVGDCYTFGPTFRAENSNTSRHLAEFWMIEPEICFANLDDVMDLTEDYVKYCLRYVLENNADDIEFFNSWVDKGLKERLLNVAEKDVVRITYTEAIDILVDHQKTKKVKFTVDKKNPVKLEWGIDLDSQHERYLAEKVFQGPIMVYNYPKSFKAFYMRGNEDGKTVQAMDMLVPGIGELVGGSAREERLDVLDAMIVEKGLKVEDYWWYRDQRKFGTQPHGGFGLGFERLVMMATGVENIRDVIPFPRTPGTADF